MHHKLAKEVIKKEKINENSPGEFHTAILGLYREYQYKKWEGGDDYPAFHRYSREQLLDLFNYFADKYEDYLGIIDEEILLRIKEKCENEFKTKIYIKGSVNRFSKLEYRIQFAGGNELSLYEARKLVEIITSCKTTSVEVIDECNRDDAFYSLPNNFSLIVKRYTVTLSTFNLAKINSELDEILPKITQSEIGKSNFSILSTNNLSLSTSAYSVPTYSPTYFKSPSVLIENSSENLKQITIELLSDFIQKKQNISLLFNQIYLLEFPFFGLDGQGQVHLKIKSIPEKYKTDLIMHLKQIKIRASLEPKYDDGILKEDSYIIIIGNIQKLRADLELYNKNNIISVNHNSDKQSGDETESFGNVYKSIIIKSEDKENINSELTSLRNQI